MLGQVFLGMVPGFYKLPIPAKFNVLLQTELKFEAILQGFPILACRAIVSSFTDKSYIKLLHHRPMLRTPSQTLLRAPFSQALLNPMALHKDLQIHQLLNALLPRQGPRTFPVSTPQQVIHQ